MRASRTAHPYKRVTARIETQSARAYLHHLRARAMSLARMFNARHSKHLTHNARGMLL